MTLQPTPAMPSAPAVQGTFDDLGTPLSDITFVVGYAAIGQRVAALGRPTIILQEGGYHVADLGANVLAWLRGFAPAG